MKPRLALVGGVIGLGAALLAGAPLAAERTVPAEPGVLAAAVSAAAPGDVLRLAPGVHTGPVTIDRPLVLRGESGAVVQAAGAGSVIRVEAPDVQIRHLTIKGSGTQLDAMDSGVLLTQAARGAVVEGNRLEGNLFGVYVHGAADALVQGNTIVGRQDLRLAEAGNGVSVWNAPGAAVVDNDIRFGRDGIFVVTSRQNRFERNRFRDLRFAVHYMYTKDSRVVGNVSERNHAGWVIMFSNGVQIVDNTVVDNRDHGLLLHSSNEAVVSGNSVIGGADSEKCAFVYNANKNRVTRNRFEDCGIGIHFTAGSDRNVVSENAFVRNRTQVKYVGTRNLDWAANGRGNYWSDHPAFDLDGNGIADLPYRPNDLMDEILWALPLAKALLNSPAVEAVRWAQRQFPALLPGGVIDSAPLMTPPAAVTATPALRASASAAETRP